MAVLCMDTKIICLFKLSFQKTRKKILIFSVHNPGLSARAQKSHIRRVTILAQEQMALNKHVLRIGTVRKSISRNNGNWRLTKL